jgi:hypothetical protein
MSAPRPLPGPDSPDRFPVGGPPLGVGAGPGRARELPERPPDRLWGGTGNGAPCAICGVRIQPSETEFELDFVASVPQRLETFRLHARCFVEWEAARLRRASAANGADGAENRRLTPPAVAGSVVDRDRAASAKPGPCAG